MLDVIHNSFEESWAECFLPLDTFAREAVLAVGIGLNYYGFLIEKQPKT